MRLTVTDEECESHICYLEERHLVHIDKRKTAGIKLHMITISADGLDVLDGITEDKGVNAAF
ncbi:MAG: hypothetical protein M0Z52_03865 [Actinomycetota bacterium]|nr:hypothetical protein [Actinomycetota bacterium]